MTPQCPKCKFPMVALDETYLPKNERGKGLTVWLCCADGFVKQTQDGQLLKMDK